MMNALFLLAATVVASGEYAEPVTLDLREDAVRVETSVSDVLPVRWKGSSAKVDVASAGGGEDPSAWVTGEPTELVNSSGEGTVQWTPADKRLYKLTMVADGVTYEAFFDLTGAGGAAEKTSLEGFTATLPAESFPATGAAIEPAVTVSDGNVTLVAGVDYEVVYADNVNVGVATANVLGKGDYSGLLSVQFEITAVDEEVAVSSVSELKVDFRQAVVRKIIKLEELLPMAWNSSATWAKGGDAGVTAALRVVLASGTDKEDPATWVDGGDETLEAGVGEDTAVWVPTQASLARAELTVGATVVNGYFDLTDCKDLEKAKPIADFSATLADIDLSCDGYAKTPKVTLVDGDGNVLVEGADYSVRYDSNLNVGTAIVTISGKGEYEGVITKTFNIVPMQPQPRAASGVGEGMIDTRVADEVALPVAMWRELPTLVFNDTKYWDRDGDTNELNMVRVTLDRLDAEGVPTGDKVTVLDEANGEGEAGWKRLKAGGYLAVSAMYKKSGKNWTLAGTNAVRRIDINGQPGLMLLVK